MKNLHLSILAFSILFSCLGCTDPAPAPVKFELGRLFPLLVGQTGESSQIQGFTIRFDKIAEDSRCPKGVECITAGKADVVLTLTKAGESKTITLPFILPNGTENVTEFKGYTIRIMGVAPIKFKDKEIKPGEYSVVLNVIETPPPMPQAKPGEAFVLGVGESIATSDDPSGIIRFDSVVGDSRCAEGVQCIWAGRADCVFSLTRGGTTQQVTLSTGDMSQGGAGEAKFDAYTLKINAINPPKKQGPAIPQKDYKATLVLMQ
jgi:hypothetical protein